MRLFAKMKVAGDRVLKEVDQEISHQDEDGRLGTGQGNAFRQHFQHGRAQHEARAQSDKVAQVAALPVFLHNHRAAQAVGQGGGKAQQDACGDWVHWEK